MNSSLGVRFAQGCGACWKRGPGCAANAAGQFSGCAEYQRRDHWIERQASAVERIDRYSRYYLAGLGCMGLAVMAAAVATGG